ncbi:hypothetical protein FA09DRAFT_331191 [Tilletiopsis washingtonensis]|jgi:SCF-associated factor 1|uniref:F-box domain-containing protein n=1 Tax=Tilletiopsis washingtonensis TaxID=58919 RepID=A0A316Z5A1_9BASI|nr:hypothetical protein FA09DRAFT_331191 [Tilletiopsis washingtonensis]PWN96731.1 hypothetical protein FA09DRAFT_331191 [Tilletiopsis washingtonensis]
MPCSLLDLPPELLLYSILPLLPSSAVLSFRLASRRANELGSDASLWRALLLRELNFPAHASARVAGWRQLYAGLRAPTLWTWGEDSEGRLGIGAGHDTRNVPQQVAALIRREWGAPFPVSPRWQDAPLIVGNELGDPDREWPYLEAAPEFLIRESAGIELGAPVELHAAGWSFLALTSTGCVLTWGALRQRQSFQYREVWTPSILDSFNKRVRRLAVGTAAIGVTDDDHILQWSGPDSPRVLPDLFPFHRVTDRPRVELLASSGDVAAVAARFHLDGEQGSATQQRIAAWNTRWTAEVDETHRSYIDIGQRRGVPVAAHDVAATLLPELPLPPDDLAATLADPSLSASRQHTAHTTVARLAAGERYLYALTPSGLLYKIDITQPAWPPDDFVADRVEEEWQGELRHFARAYGPGGRQWQLLRAFCDPLLLRADARWAAMDKAHLLSAPELRLTHLSANFRSFVAYSQPSTNDGAHAQGIVLLGDEDAGHLSPPKLLPELQGSGVLKVAVGDYHFASLDSAGKVRTWGQWSKGALGTWDAHPVASSLAVAPPQPRGLRGGFRIGLAGATARRTQQSFEPQDDGTSPLSRRCAARHVPREQKEPVQVAFADCERLAEPGGSVEEQTANTFVFDIALAG